MGFSYSPTGENQFKVVSSIDDTLGPNADYKKYLDTLDESHLDLQGVPTRFVMRRRLPYKLSQKVASAQMTMKDGEMQFNAGYINDEVRVSLTGIEFSADCPAPFEFKKDGDGGAHTDIMEILLELGVVMDLFAARATAVKAVTDQLKKKSTP